jgi:hypothetical protein
VSFRNGSPELAACSQNRDFPTAIDVDDGDELVDSNDEEEDIEPGNIFASEMPGILSREQVESKIDISKILVLM